MGKPVPNAFTLIELMVVIAIMAVIGVFTLANYGSFGEDQNLKNAVLDIQSMLRTAQTNATANVKCNTGYSATWQVEFTSASTLNLKCSASSDPQRTLQLAANITQTVSGTGSRCPTAPPFISFDPLTGKVGFGDQRCTSLTITLQNSKTGSMKSFTIEQEGGIYVPSPTPALTECLGNSSQTCFDICEHRYKTAVGGCAPGGGVCTAQFSALNCTGSANYNSGCSVVITYPYLKCCCQ